MPYMTETEHSNIQKKLSEQDNYIAWCNDKIAALTTRLQEAEAIIKPIAELPDAHCLSRPQYEKILAWLKGGTN